jgi:hypothetical protein
MVWLYRRSEILLQAAVCDGTVVLHAGAGSGIAAAHAAAIMPASLDAGHDDDDVHDDTSDARQLASASGLLQSRQLRLSAGASAQRCDACDIQFYRHSQAGLDHGERDAT